MEVLEKVPAGYRMPKPNPPPPSPPCPDSLYELMKECWNFEPMQRPTFEYMQVCLTQHYRFITNTLRHSNIFTTNQNEYVPRVTCGSLTCL